MLRICGTAAGSRQTSVFEYSDINREARFSYEHDYLVTLGSHESQAQDLGCFKHINNGFGHISSGNSFHQVLVIIHHCFVSYCSKLRL